MGFNLDIGKMKFLKSDEKSTTLQHPKGHTVTIAHSVLSPKNREALQALSKVATDARTPDQASEYGKVTMKATGGKARQMFMEGGDAKPKTFLGQQVYGTGVSKPQPVQQSSPADQDAPWPPPSTTSVGQAAAARWQQQQQQMKDSPQSEAEGGRICKACGGPMRKMYADPDEPVDKNDAAPQSISGTPDVGGVQQVAPYQPPKTDQEARNAKMQEAMENYRNAAHKVHSFLMDGPMKKYYPDEEDQEQPQSQQTPGPTASQPQDVDQNGKPLLHTATVEDANTKIEDDGGPEGPDPNAPPAIQGHTNPATISHEDKPLSPSGQMVSGNQTGVSQPQAQPSGPQAQPTIADTKQAASNELTQHVQAFQNDLDAGHITPKTYSDLFHYKGGDKAKGERSTLSKIGSIFGMLVSGMGSGLAHQPNMAFEMMNNQIKNDLEAQQNSSANRQNFLRINQQGLMNQAQENQMSTETAIKARALTNIQMNQTALHYLNVLANGQGNEKELPEAQKAFPNVNRQQAQQLFGMVAPMFNTENARIQDLAASKLAFFNQAYGGQKSGDPAMQVRKLRIMGAITPEQEDKALKEVGDVNNLRQSNEIALNAFDKVSKMTTALSYAKEPIQNQRKIDGIWKPMMDKLTKNNTGRVTPMSVELMNSWKSRVGNSDETNRALRQEMHDTLYQNIDTPTLTSLGIAIHKGEPEVQPQSQQQYKEGDILHDSGTGRRIILKGNQWLPYGQ